MPSDPLKLKPSQTLQQVLERVRKMAEGLGEAPMPAPPSSARPPRHWQEASEEPDGEIG